MTRYTNMSMLTLWEQYSAYKIWNGKGNYSRQDAIWNKLNKLPDTNNPQLVIDGLLANLKPKVFLDVFRDIYAGHQWAVREKLTKSNPLEWLKYQLIPVYRDIDFAKKLKGSPKCLETVNWWNLLPAPTGQEIAKIRAVNGVGINGGFVVSSIQPSWFLHGEPPTLLMMQPSGYVGIRNTVTCRSEMIGGKIRLVMFDKNYMAAMKQQKGVEPPLPDGQVRITLSSITTLAATARRV